MFTSVINDRREYFNCFDYARLYVLAAVNAAVFSAIYEHFSFGVYSPFMIFAFAVHLLIGALPILQLARACKKVSGQHLDATEFLNVQLYTTAQIDAMVQEGNFQQAMHVLAWLLAKNHDS